MRKDITLTSNSIQLTPSPLHACPATKCMYREQEECRIDHESSGTEVANGGVASFPGPLMSIEVECDVIMSSECSFETKHTSVCKIISSN